MNEIQKRVNNYMDAHMENYNLIAVKAAWKLIKPLVMTALDGAEDSKYIAGCRVLGEQEYEDRCNAWYLSGTSDYVVVELPEPWNTWEAVTGKDISSMFEGTDYRLDDASDQFGLLVRRDSSEDNPPRKYCCMKEEMMGECDCEESE